MRSGTTILMDFDRDHLGVIGVSGRGASLRIDGWRLVRRPDEIRSSEPGEIGAWLKRELGEGGISGGRVVLGAPRSEVVLKLITLPGGASLDAHELADVVRLQMLRQTAVAIEDAVLDYLPLDAEQASSDRQVLVGAIPGDRLAWRRRVLDAAGLKFGGLRLRASGIAELIGASTGSEDAPSLGVAIGPASVEFALIERGRLVFARTADLPAIGDDRAALASRIAVEAKRTAMSFRVAQQTPDVGAVIVLGDDGLARETSERCAEMLEVPSRTHLPTIQGIERLPGEAARALCPLVGLAIQDEHERPGLDFVNPRRAPDKMQAKRRIAMAAVLGVLLIGGAGYVARSVMLGSLSTELEGAAARATALRGEYLDALARDARAEHLEAWISAAPRWSGHVEQVSGLLPPPDAGPLDSITLSSDPGVAYSGGSGAPYPGTWASDSGARIAIEGRASSRGVSTALRERILEDGRYSISVRGADVADRFSIDLRPSGGAP